MTIAKEIKTIQSKSSWIRKMFEEGARLKAEHGAENVFDFSLGNPNLEPPEKFRSALQEAVMHRKKGEHGYMPNVGYPHVRKSLADYLCTEQEVEITENELIMTCGAAGALNVSLKAILDPTDEVITPAPFFVEYTFYANNHGGILKSVSTKPDFDLDIDAISAAITEKTKAVLINSPNNPTGQVYHEERLEELGVLLKKKSENLNRIIYLISDEPYRKIVYDGQIVPSVFKYYPDSIIATYKKDLIGGMALANRILGFVNAPALMQRVVASLQGERVDISAYARKRDILCDGLAACGYEFVRPSGAFYLFPKTPIPDDVKFVQKLQQEMILAVPGSGFGGPGHFRIAFCVDDETITRALPGFKQVIEDVSKKNIK
jgi:aspartate aminotransferase